MRLSTCHGQHHNTQAPCNSTLARRTMYLVGFGLGWAVHVLVRLCVGSYECDLACFQPMQLPSHATDSKQYNNQAPEHMPYTQIAIVQKLPACIVLTTDMNHSPESPAKCNTHACMALKFCGTPLDTDFPLLLMHAWHECAQQRCASVSIKNAHENRHLDGIRFLIFFK